MMHKGKQRGVAWVLLGILGLSAPLCGAAEKKAVKESPATAAAQPKAEPTPMDTPLLKVDDFTITSREYAAFLQAHPQIVSRAMSTEAGKAAALKEMVTAYLLRKAMYDEGFLARDNKAPAQKEMIEAYEKLAGRHFPLPKSPSDEAAYAFYQAHPSNYGIPAMIRLSEILIKVDPKADAAVKAAAKARAEKVLARLVAGASFADVAVAVTENPVGKITRGDIGFIDLDKEAWMRPAVEPLKNGERTGVMESPEGFVIFSVTDIRPAVISPYANIRDKVMEDLKHEEQEKLRAPYVASLAVKSRIEVVSPYIQPLFPNGLFPKP